MIEKGSERIWTFSPAWHDSEKVFSKQQMITKIKMPCANILPAPARFTPALFMYSQGVKWVIGSMSKCMELGLETFSTPMLLAHDMTFELITPNGSTFDHPLTVQVWTCDYNPIALEIASLKVDQQIHMDALEETNKKLNSLYEQMYKEACEPKESNPEENIREQLRIQTEHIEQIKQIIRGDK